jgi:signal transduction histidine kinase
MHERRELSHESSVDVLVNFSRLISSTESPAEILPRLAEAAAEHLGADAAAVLQVGDDGYLRVAASYRLPDELALWAAPAGSAGEELVEAVVEAARGHFVEGRSFALVSSGDLFGVLIVLCRHECELDPRRVELASGLVDLAAIALRKAYQYTSLQRSLAELRATRAMVERTEKLRALGQAAAGIAHDLKNLLNPLSLNVTVLRRRLQRGETRNDDVLDSIDRVLRQGQDTLERLREFSRQTPDRLPELRRLDELARHALELARARVGPGEKRIAFVEELSDPPPVELVASECVTALLNLIVNAVDAIAEQGTVWLRSGAQDGGSWVAIADDGPGIPPEIEKHIYEPFFTTKGAEGTGLGLSLAYAFAQRHRGRITCETAAGKGTTFTLWFPWPAKTTR